MSSSDLLDTIGVSAFAICDPDHIAGVSKLPNIIAAPIISLQSFLLQSVLLYYMVHQLIPRGVDPNAEKLPYFIVFTACYLHFLDCIQDLPYAIQLFRHLHNFQSGFRNLSVTGAMLITDAFVVPLATFALGAMYICTSKTIGDVILNCVAVSFVSQIDNWVVTLDNRTNFLAGRIESRTINIPTSIETMRYMSWALVYAPVIPMLAAWGICYISFNVLML